MDIFTDIVLLWALLFMALIVGVEIFPFKHWIVQICTGSIIVMTLLSLILDRNPFTWIEYLDLSLTSLQSQIEPIAKEIIVALVSYF